jgi:hypothetical protein
MTNDYHQKTPSVCTKGVCLQLQTCKPGFVPSAGRRAASIIDLALLLPTGSSNLPIPATIRTVTDNTETSSLTSGTYLVFQLLRFTAIPVARKSRELLPHVFTLIRHYCRTVYFLWHLLSPAAGAFPLGSRMLCVARTFLRPPYWWTAIERSA